jgi:hypothetical protein
MKKLLLSIILLVGLTFQAQELSDFEGLWGSDKSTYYIAIMEHEGKVEFADFSFYQGHSIEEKVLELGDDYIVTKINYKPNDWEVTIKYTFVNEDTLLCEYSGSTDVKVHYNRIKLN